MSHRSNEPDTRELATRPSLATSAGAQRRIHHQPPTLRPLLATAVPVPITDPCPYEWWYLPYSVVYCTWDDQPIGDRSSRQINRDTAAVFRLSVCRPAGLGGSNHGDVTRAVHKIGSLSLGPARGGIANVIDQRAGAWRKGTCIHCVRRRRTASTAFPSRDCGKVLGTAHQQHERRA